MAPQPFATHDTPCGFPMAIMVYGDGRTECRTTVEMLIILAAAEMRDKPRWWEKIHEEAIVDHYVLDLLERMPPLPFFRKKAKINNETEEDSTNEADGGGNADPVRTCCLLRDVIVLKGS